MISYWNRRIFTPIGKINVVKSLLAPIFTHLFIMLPTLPVMFMDKLNKLLYDFVWNGPCKIKCSVIVKNYEEGCLEIL